MKCIIFSYIHIYVLIVFQLLIDPIRNKNSVAQFHQFTKFITCNLNKVIPVFMLYLSCLFPPMVSIISPNIQNQRVCINGSFRKNRQIFLKRSQLYYEYNGFKHVLPKIVIQILSCVLRTKKEIGSHEIHQNTSCGVCPEKWHSKVKMFSKNVLIQLS